MTAGDKIAFQGMPGAYSDMACRAAYPGMESLPCPSFETAVEAVRGGAVTLAMLPIENSVAGRVADIYHLLPHTGLRIIGEHFEPVSHLLLGSTGAKIDSVRRVHSHIHALSQCRKMFLDRGFEPVVHADTAGAAKEVGERGDPTEAAIASRLAAEIYNLKVLLENIEDDTHNTTRFIVMARDAIDPDPDSGPTLTTFVFRVRNVPAALYKCLGGFATNGVNMTKLESYMVAGDFVATEFYADIEGHPSSRSVTLALEELEFFCDKLEILGVYPAADYRWQKGPSS